MKFNILKLRQIIWLASLSIILSACSGLSTKQEQTLLKLRQDVQLTQGLVNAKLEDSPESALRNSISTLDTILEYTATVKSDPSKFSPEKIQAYILKISIINENMERFSDLTLQTDVSFPLGTYKLEHLAQKGQIKINELASNIIVSIQEMAAKYPQKPIKVMIKTVGYTDETGLIAGGQLEQAILKSMTQAVESEPNKKRQQFNQILSQFRAATLNRYVVQRLQQQLPAVYQITMTKEIVGVGEKMPNRKSTEAPYDSTDPRRRVCIISPFVEIIP